MTMIMFALLGGKLGASDSNKLETLNTNSLEQIKAQVAAEESNATAAAEERGREIAQGIWNASLPRYRYYLTVLRDQLFKEATREGDRIFQFEEYTLPDVPGHID